MEVPRVAVSVDLVILTVRESQLSVLAWRRHAEPHLGRWALPGGFIRLDEDLPGTAARVLAERAGLPGARVHLEQLQTYGYPDRDPRARVLSVAYLGLAPDLPAPDHPRMSWQPVADLSEMAFDHRRILQDGVERARAKLEYTTLGAAFCRDTFTVAELRKVYEIVWGTLLDPRNFHRKVTGAERFLVDTGSSISSGGRLPSCTGAATPTCCTRLCSGLSPRRSPAWASHWKGSCSSWRTMMSVRNPRFRPILDQFSPYKPGKPPAATEGPVYKLSSNESPFGPLPSVLKVIAEAAAEVNRYPDNGAAELTEAIAARYSVPPEHIALGCGSVGAGPATARGGQRSRRRGPLRMAILRGLSVPV